MRTYTHSALTHSTVVERSYFQSVKQWKTVVRIYPTQVQNVNCITLLASYIYVLLLEVKNLHSSEMALVHVTGLLEWWNTGMVD